MVDYSIKLVLVAVQITATILFLGYIWRKWGIQESVSHSYIRLREKFGKNSLRAFVLFAGYLALMGIPIYIILDFSGWGFLSMCGLILVGFARDFDIKSVEVPHIVGAMVGIAAAFIGVGVYGFQHDMWWISFAIVPQAGVMLYLNNAVKVYNFDINFALVTRKPVSNYTTWIELSSVLLIVVAEIILICALR